MITRIQRYD